MANPYSIPQNFSTTLNVGGGITNSQTASIVLTSVTGLPTDGGILAFDWANPIDTTTIEYIEYTGISGNTLTGVIRGVEGVSAKAHTNGCTVVGVVSQAHIKRVRDKLTGNDLTVVQDTSNNAILKAAFVASAVNQITVQNAATGNDPQVSATGNDTDISLKITPKGAGKIKLGTGNIQFPNTDGSANQVLQTNGSGVLSFATVSNPTDGWTADSNTWVYASASTFTIAGVDLTTTFTPGTKIKFTQSATVKYAVVASSSFSTNTTVTIMISTDYTLANAVISANYYSYQTNPQGWPTFFNFTPVATGFSATSTLVSQYSVQGRQITYQVICVGTSNANTFVLTVPVTGIFTTIDTYFGRARATDNGALLANGAQVCYDATSLRLFKDDTQAVWTTSAGKSAYFTLIYRF